MESYSLHQLISEPTRFTLNSSSLIDLIICSNTYEILNSSVLSSSLSTDHEIVSCTLFSHTSKNGSITRTYRNFKDFDLESFKKDLQLAPFDIIFNLDNIDAIVNYFNDLIIYLFDLHAPLKTVKITKPKAPWLTDNLRLMMTLRDKARCRYKQTHNLND